jgi:hypothetical protein
MTRVYIIQRVGIGERKSTRRQSGKVGIWPSETLKRVHRTIPTSIMHVAVAIDGTSDRL